MAAAITTVMDYGYVVYWGRYVYCVIVESTMWVAYLTILIAYWVYC